MSAAPTDFDRLLNEHIALGRQYGEAQDRCSRLVVAQRAEIERQNAQVMELRAAVIVRDTALAYAREDRAQLEASIPGLPKRVKLVRHVETLMARIRTLMRERLDWQWRTKPPASKPPHTVELNQEQGRQHGHTADEDLAGLEASLIAADLVICQTGCLSHGAYWRVQDHCKRTGKPCVLTAEPDALRIVRIHKHGAITERTEGADVLVAEKGACP